ncbi:MAG: hypothetical protein ACJ76N_13935 [Thermoanaerobaculia bacterium]
MKHPAFRYLLAAAGGVLWGLCFGKSPLSLAAWIALAPLILLLSAPRPGRLGWVHGYAAWMTGLYWIVPTLQTYGGIAFPIAVALTSLLAGYLALFHAVFAWLGSKIWRRWIAARILVLPALWVALEWLRTYLGGGFPWNLAAYSWVEVPGALPLSAWIGAYGIGFLVLLTSVAVAASVSGGAGSRRRSACSSPCSCSPSPGAGACGRMPGRSARCPASAAPSACSSRTSPTWSDSTRRR